MRTNRMQFRLATLAAVLVSLAFGQAPASAADSPAGLALSVEIGGVSATAPGPRIIAGTPITVVFTVANVGGKTVHGVTLSDDELGVVGCAATKLAAGRSTTCEVSVEALAGRYRSTAVVSATTGGGAAVEASQRVGYRGLALPWVADLDLEVLMDGIPAGLPGPVLTKGDSLEITYRVTNAGTVPLARLKVTDDHQAVPCPVRALEPGETVECIAAGTVAAGRFRGRAVAVARDARGERVTEALRFGYFGERPILRAEFEAVALAGGLPGSAAPGPMVSADRSIAWAIEVTNTGNDHLWGLYARDLDEGRMECESPHLAPGESARCTVWGRSIGGPMVGEIEVSAWATDGQHLTELVPRFAFGYRPGADLLIETYVDGFDADAHAGPRRVVGSTLSLTYRVYNIGTVDLTRVRVSDALLGTVACPVRRLRFGEWMECTKETTAQLGWWETAGKARGFDGVGSVRDSDKTFWHVRTEARISRIDLRVTVGGVDAASGPGPRLVAGERVEIVYRATNTGNSPLWSMEIRDPAVPASAMTCSASLYVLPGVVVTCRATMVVEPGRQIGSIEAVGWNSDGTRIVGSDTIYYVGRPGPT